ncbi:MAG: PAS domain-containing protein [Ferruginibacter sp.]
MIFEPEKKAVFNDFAHLPQFIQFVLDTCLEKYVQNLLSSSRGPALPSPSFFIHMNNEELSDFLLQSSKDYLTPLALNRSTEAIEKSLQSYIKIELYFSERVSIEPGNIFLLSYLHKRALREILKNYSEDLHPVFEILDEIDLFFVAYDQSATNNYMQLFRNKIEEDRRFKEKLTVTSPGFYYIYDLVNDKQLESSDKLFEYLGYSKDEYGSNNRFFRSIIHPDDFVAAQSYFQKLQQADDKGVLFFEYRLKDKNGRYRWMRNYESIYWRNALGRPEHVIGVAFDIAKERFITEELVKREEELLEAQELSNMGSFVWDLLDNHSFVTQRGLKILGLKEGQPLEEFQNNIHPTDRKVMRKTIENAIKGTGDLDYEYRCTIDNEEKIVWSRGKVIFENGKAKAIKGTVMDVTDRHYMIQKLRRSEELYRQAQSLNKLGNWTWDIRKDELHWSDELYRIFGMEPQSEAVSFQKFISFVHDDDRENRLKKLSEQMTDTMLHEYFFRINSADGLEKILYGQSQVLADESGVPYKMIGTCQDVTRQKELENSLYQKTIQLQRSNASLEEFAYITSHDLKEPLRKIAVFSDRLVSLNGDILTAEAKLTVDKIIDSAKRMQRMVDDILSLSRISSELYFKTTNLNVLLNEVVQTLEYSMEELEVKLLCSQLPEAYVNEIQFRQLFQNLITNAIKFRKPGLAPEINITADYLDKQQNLQYNLNPLNKYLRIIFKDNGIGFENQFSDKIFTIFQRLHSRDVFEGTGIGLAICKKIVEHHHGLILATGTPGEGASFTIIIPANR